MSMEHSSNATPGAGRRVAILGGGLAGLTLALQLHQRLPGLEVVVLERRAHPVPEAAHKVGESTVEIGAHYFAEVLGLKPHLDAAQLRKFGFRFFFNDGRADIDRTTELGAGTVLPTPTWQIDRGIFENALGALVRARGMRLLDGAVVRAFDLGERGGAHSVRFTHEGAEHTLVADWLIDASGRAGLIKRKLGLAQDNDHHANAVWFRIAERIDVDAWSHDAHWLTRCDPPRRWASTNHLCGDGYWTWLIPLASGAHSVGIVCDAQMHPIEGMNTFDKAMRWFEKHQPQLHAHLDARRDKLQDFLFFKNFSYGATRMWDGQARWALTGEAGVFLDPFYSPGSDFIAIANGFVTELVAQDLDGGPTGMLADIYQSVFFSLYRNMLPIYTGQYRIFGNSRVMPVKVLWDYTYYWGVMCPLYFQNKLTDVATMGRLLQPLAAVQKLNVAVQDLLRAWDLACSPAARAADAPAMLDQARLPWFAELNRGLTDRLDDAGFQARLHQGLALLDALALQIVGEALRDDPTLDVAAVRAHLSHPTGAAPVDGLLFPALPSGQPHQAEPALA